MIGIVGVVWDGELRVNDLKGKSSSGGNEHVIYTSLHTHSRCG
jgi:hypothetical protein